MINLSYNSDILVVMMILLCIFDEIIEILY